MRVLSRGSRVRGGARSDPVWLVDIGKCVCTDNDPANCVYAFCCALSFKWDTLSCTCVPDTGDDC